jgi:anti-anti-sigma regulatory factor
MQPISIACFDQDVWIRVTGRGNFLCSTALKQAVQERIDKGYYRYVIDLKECDQLDSTFMGTVTGIAQRLNQYQESLFKVVNVSQSNQELMENLGLDELFCIQPISMKYQLPPDLNSSCFTESSFSLSPSEEKSKIHEVVVAAHKSLIEANEDNAQKFKDVFEVCSEK